MPPLNSRRVYAKRRCSLTNEQAQAFDAELVRLVRERRVGNVASLRPEDIVEDARSPDTAYHRYIWGIAQIYSSPQTRTIDHIA